MVLIFKKKTKIQKTLVSGMISHDCCFYPTFVRLTLSNYSWILITFYRFECLLLLFHVLHFIKWSIWKYSIRIIIVQWFRKSITIFFYHYDNKHLKKSLHHKSIQLLTKTEILNMFVSKFFFFFFTCCDWHMKKNRNWNSDSWFRIHFDDNGKHGHMSFDIIYKWMKETKTKCLTLHILLTSDACKKNKIIQQQKNEWQWR